MDIGLLQSVQLRQHSDLAYLRLRNLFSMTKNVALIFSGAAGAGTPNLSGGGVLSFTSADTVHDLSGRGVSLNAGGSAGLVVAAGIEFMTGSDRNGKTIYGVRFSVGVGPIPAELHANLYRGSYVPYKIGKLQIQGFSEPTTPNKIKQSYHITQKAARSRPRAAFLRGKLGRRQDFSKK